MEVITIGTKNQIVIPKGVRSKIKGLIPGAKVIIKSLDNQTITIKKVSDNWIERTSGMMTKAWQGIDAPKEVNKIKNEWEEKLQDLEKNK